MNLEKWQTIIGRIKDNFSVAEQGEYQDEQEGGRQVEFIIFSSPIGQVKLEFICQPKVIDKKVIYSNRIGAPTQVEYIYDPKEKVYKLMAYKWDEDRQDWQEIKSSDLGL